jgi:DNA-binding protein H-NS
MAKINVDAMSLKELVALEAKLRVAIEDARLRAKAEVKAKMAELAQQHGFSVGELFGSRGRHKTIGAPKFANPDNRAETWTGRGRPPLWFIAQMKKGKNRDELTI